MWGLIGIPQNGEDVFLLLMTLWIGVIAVSFVVRLFQSSRGRVRLESSDQAALQVAFKTFVAETKRMTRRAAVHPKAGLYRQVWKRAVVLERMAEDEGDGNAAGKYRDFQRLASAEYYAVAPKNAYGVVQLRLSADAAQRLRELERKRLVAPPPAARKKAQYACVYVGYDSEHHRPYVGQTRDEPERRWRQHRADRTGPFKSGASYAEWKILAEHVSPNKLDETESYFIGRCGAFETGHNDTCGYDRAAYERGVRDAAESRPSAGE